MQPKYYEIQPRSGSHYLLENGEPIARFNGLEKAESARAMYVAEIGAMYERNAERFTSTRGEKEAVIKAYDTLVTRARRTAKSSKEPRRCWLPPATALWLSKKGTGSSKSYIAARSARKSNSLHTLRYP